MSILLLITNTSMIISNILLICMISKLLNKMHVPTWEDAPRNEGDAMDELLDHHAKEREEKKRAFTERIERIKGELTREAEELHPHVKNLPHDSVRASDVGDVEYAD